MDQANISGFSKLTDAFLTMMDTFMIAITCRGQIVLVSTQIEKHLGHCQVCLILFASRLHSFLNFLQNRKQ